MSIYEGNFCRCCAADGSSKDLITTYNWMGEEEVYADMLRECFDIVLDTGNEDGICELCITQLRNAFNFKKQVLHTEEQFKTKGFFKEKTLAQVKVEVEQMKSSDSETDMLDTGGDQDSEYDVPIKVEEEPEVKPKARPKRRAAAAATSKTKKVKSEGEMSKSTTVRKKKHAKKTSATPERIEHRHNLTVILQHSNASPFRDKTASGFSCLYCAKHFQDIDSLRAHTAQKSEKIKINKMIDYKLSYNPIKVDVTDLVCLLCYSPMYDLNDLKDHLVSRHGKRINKEIKDIILPFRLGDGTNFTCVVCSVVHVSFKNLYQHMSCHYRNYCCETCGAGYITIAALRKHYKTHEDGNFPCTYCDKVYTSRSKKRNHEKGVHEAGGWLRNKCPHCTEIFVSYYDRSEHLVKVHNEKRITYPCNACSKVYRKKYELNRHIRHFHLKQKSYICNVCNDKFFSRRGMIDHMVRHTGGETFCCDVCGKRFSRQRTLKDHMRTHEDDTRFQCDTCNKKFTQKCSLKSHMRLHQDLEIFKEFEDVNHLIDDRDLTLKQIAQETKKKAEEEKVARQQQEQYINL